MTPMGRNPAREDSLTVSSVSRATPQAGSLARTFGHKLFAGVITAVDSSDPYDPKYKAEAIEVPTGAIAVTTFQSALGRWFDVADEIEMTPAAVGDPCILMLAAEANSSSPETPVVQIARALTELYLTDLCS